MISKQRVFSHANDINYIDYTENKKGVEMLKTIKHEYNNAENEYKELWNDINRFKNQDEFLTLSKSYYNYLNQNECVPEFITNMYNSNVSYILEDKTIQQESCNKTNSPLYPYGKINTNNKCNLFYPYKIDINNWCSDKKTLGHYTCNEVEPFPVCIPHPVKNKTIIPPNYAPPNYAPQNYAPPNYASKPIYIPTPIYLPNSFSENNIHPIHEYREIKTKCDKCKTSICKKGLCQTCNKNKNNNCQKCNSTKSCDCRKVMSFNNAPMYNYSKPKKILKTGVSF